MYEHVEGWTKTKYDGVFKTSPRHAIQIARCVICGATKTHGAITTTQMCGDCQHVPQYDFVLWVSEQSLAGLCLVRCHIHMAH